jgi:hypothetical protein
VSCFHLSAFSASGVGAELAANQVLAIVFSTLAGLDRQSRCGRASEESLRKICMGSRTVRSVQTPDAMSASDDDD